MVQPRSMNGLRSYSTFVTQAPKLDHNNTTNSKEMKIKKNKSMKNDANLASKNWSFSVDPELQRKKRVAGYKAYTVEGKMKGSVIKSFRWIKQTCNQVVHGIW